MHIALLKKMAFVVVVAGICITAYLCYSKKEDSINTIKLQLANGHVIDLNKVRDIHTQLNNTLSHKRDSTGMNSLTTPIGMDYKIRLNDGTEVWLNALTQLDFPFAFTGNTREITINGEAYLKIAKDESKPFIVHLPHNDVRVLGTTFNVNSYDSGIVKVSLVEGALNVQQGEKTISVKPGMEIISDGKITLHNFDERQVLGWRKGMYYFYDADLKEISKVLPRWFGITVVIDNPTIINKKFVGVVDKNQPIEVFIDNLRTVADIDCFYDKPQNTLHFK
jgi:ferric-dicitrate binding protein FerR (iron transport regulator)